MYVVERGLTHLKLNHEQQLIAAPASFVSEFDTEAYSKFKYGDGTIAHYYSHALFRLLEHNGDVSRETPLFVGGSAYHRTPTAAVAIARKLLQTLCEYRYSAFPLRIRCAPYASDYGAMDIPARAKTMSGTSLNVAPELWGQGRGNTVVIVDDIRITGMHEQELVTFLERCAVSTVFFCYVAILDQADGMKYPRIEDTLNHAFVQRLEQVVDIVGRPHFYPNARLCKFILNADLHEVADFGKRIPGSVLGQLLRYMEADGYSLLPHCRPAFQLLRSILTADTA